jgi:hypothetical protein
MKHFESFPLRDEVDAVDAIDMVLEETTGIALVGGTSMDGDGLLKHRQEVVGKRFRGFSGSGDTGGVDAVVAPTVAGQ